jgi:ABC-type antimicrobial peptide transport system permease subunit
VLGLHLVRGRFLGPQDASGATRAAVINERMANHLWPGENPIGKHLLNVNDAPAPGVWNAAKASVIVGVVRNAHEGSLAAGFEDEAYLPMTPATEQPVMYALLRSRATPAETAEGLRSVVAGIDSLVPVTRVRSLDQVVAGSVAAPRALAVLLLAFAALAFLIGAVGVYSLIAYTVSGRTREFGLRLALGSQRWQILIGVIRQSLFLAIGGCIAGLAASWALGRALRSFLFGVSALDPLTFTLVPLLMILVAIAAACIPARRAASIDPMQALRSD